MLALLKQMLHSAAIHFFTFFFNHVVFVTDLNVAQTYLYDLNKQEFRWFLFSVALVTKYFNIAIYYLLGLCIVITLGCISLMLLAGMNE